MHGSESDLHLSFRQCSDDRYGANTSSGIKGLNVKKFRQSHFLVVGEVLFTCMRSLQLVLTHLLPLQIS